MKYFGLTNSVILNEIGKTYPQSQESIHYSERDGMYYFIWNPKMKIPDDFKYPVPILDKRATTTDLISHSGFSSFSLLVSERLKNLLFANCSSDDFHFFETTLKTKKGDLKYWGINPIVSKDECIDFEKSTFLFKDGETYATRIIKIKNEIEYRELIEKEWGINHIKIDNLKINETVNVDFFCINGVSDFKGFIVSEKLKQIITELNFSGISFIEF